LMNMGAAVGALRFLVEVVLAADDLGAYKRTYNWGFGQGGEAAQRIHAALITERP
jgi:hypothetical protein